MLYQFMKMIENLLGKMYIEGTFLNKSQNNALINLLPVPNQYKILIFLSVEEYNMSYPF